MNIALGVNFAWRLVSRVNEWWKDVLLSKYSNGSRFHCLDSPIPSSKGSPIWNLIKEIYFLIQSHVSWKPRDGKAINIWYDIIMENTPLGTCNDLQTLK
jgi:hypothetical protein